MTASDDSATPQTRGLSRRSIIGATAATGLLLLARPIAAHAADPVIEPGSCVWQSSAGISHATGTASYVEGELSPAVVTSCSAGTVQPFSDYTSISSPFGMRIHPISGARSMHYGTDYSRYNIRGTAIRSIAAGTVTYTLGSYATSGTGNTIVIAHAGNVKTQYMHLAQPPALAVGARVEAGQVIGYVGSTGGATGPHLHLEVRVNNTHVDPVPFLASAPFLR